MNKSMIAYGISMMLMVSTATAGGKNTAIYVTTAKIVDIEEVYKTYAGDDTDTTTTKKKDEVGGEVKKEDTKLSMTNQIKQMDQMIADGTLKPGDVHTLTKEDGTTIDYTVPEAKTELEQEKLEYYEQREVTAKAEDAEKKVRDKIKPIKKAEMAGGIKDSYAALASIGGQIGAKNPLIDMQAKALKVAESQDQYLNEINSTMTTTFKG